MRFTNFVSTVTAHFLCEQFNGIGRAYAPHDFLLNSCLSYKKETCCGDIIFAATIQFPCNHAGAWLTHMATRADSRRSGIAGDFILAMKDMFPAIRLGCHVYNTIAQNFYKKHGFKRVCLREDFVRLVWINK